MEPPIISKSNRTRGISGEMRQDMSQTRRSVEVGWTIKRHTSCPPTVSQSICWLSLQPLLWRAEAGGTGCARLWWGCWHMAVCLYFWEASFYVPYLQLVRDLGCGIGMRNAWSRSPTEEADILIDQHTLALTPSPSESTPACDLMPPCDVTNGWKLTEVRDTSSSGILCIHCVGGALIIFDSWHVVENRNYM